MDTKNIKEYIRALEHMTQFFRNILEQENKFIPAPQTETERLREITELRGLVHQDQWPVAIEPYLISNQDSEDDKLIRAEGIIQDFIKTPLANKNFLDIGCGEGYVTYLSSFDTKKSVGYDIISQNWDHFDKKDNLEFVTSAGFQDKFDVILLNDVLDHADKPIELLKLAKNAQADNGTIHVRCHPWTSRHGTHLYRQLNKAYLHLVFTEPELYGLGLIPEKVNPLIDPINTYKEWFAEAGLKIVREEAISQDIETFFTTQPVLLRRIKEKFVQSHDVELASGTKFPRDIIQIQFADFVLN
jgi:2-polyprenyl-3-methyl-5-hydroxy-6-metoxy-1,4-benzoquinol methylase